MVLLSRKIKVRSGNKYVEIQKRSGGKVVDEKYDEERVGEGTFHEEPVMVEAKLGMTVSLGNYEFLRVDAGVTLPCTEETISATQSKAFSLAGAELFKRVEEAKKTLIN